MSVVKNLMVASTIAGGVTFAAPALSELPGIGNVFGATQSFAKCTGETESGKNMSAKTFDGTGAAKACGAHIAMHGFKNKEDATGHMVCPKSTCKVKEADYKYDFETNVVTVIADGHKSRFNAGQYTSKVVTSSHTKAAKPDDDTAGKKVTTGKKPKIEDSRECNIFKGLVFEGVSPACK